MGWNDFCSVFGRTRMSPFQCLFERNAPLLSLRVAFFGAFICLGTGLIGCSPSAPKAKEQAQAVEKGEAATGTNAVSFALPEHVTFSKDVAPVIYGRCAVCHRPGQAAPFSLLTFDDVAKRTKQIFTVTQNGSMPPWLPEPQADGFLHERRLDPRERALFKQWIAEGAPKGNPADLPPRPEFRDEWTLGKPDLVVAMPRSYLLGAEGADVYRNFLIPVGLDRDRYVRAVEFVSGNAKIVHHAFIKVDSTGAARRLETKDGPPGFDGMSAAAVMPEGQFLTWHPGEPPIESPAGMPWRLSKGSDVVLQLHLNRSGKPEGLKASVGFYFTDTPPTNQCVKIELLSLSLDFPAGATNVVVTDAYRLPIDAQALAILPHAHYLAREMEAEAELPNGSKVQLLRIKRWDFQWQGSYRYEHPIDLPKGTLLSLRYTYDNSTNNPANPNCPPKRVRYGPQTSDEMCELWLQLLPRRRAETSILLEDHNRHMLGVMLDRSEQAVILNPGSAAEHTELGTLLLWSDKERARRELTRAIGIDPGFAKAHYELGTLLRSESKWTDARRELETAVRLDPENGKAYGHLGFVMAELGEIGQAERCFREALRIDPSDGIAKEALAELLAALRKSK